jgi:hypothetical protein
MFATRIHFGFFEARFRNIVLRPLQGDDLLMDDILL